MAVNANATSNRVVPDAWSRVLRLRPSDFEVQWLAFACISMAGLAFVLWKGSGNGFFWDDWSFIEGRRTGLDAMLTSYNQHLVIGGIAVYQLLLTTVGLAHYWVYRLLAVIGHLAVATAVFAFARRRIGVMALLPAAVVVFLGSGWDYILEFVAFGFTVSIALGIVAFLALDRDDRRGDLVGCGLLVLGLVCCEFALLFAAGIAVELTWRDRGLRRAWVWATQLAMYLVWWVAYSPGTSSHADLLTVPKFVVNMASSAAGGLFGLNLVQGRPVLLVLVGLVGWRIARRRAMSPRLAGLLTILAAFWMLVAVGRAGNGQPWASRYVYTSAVVIVLIVVESCRGMRLAPAPAVGAVVLAGLALIGNIRAFNGGENYLHTGAQTVSAELTALQLARAYAPWGMPLDSQYGPQIIAGPYFAAADAIGSTGAKSIAELSRAPERLRAAADAVLLRSGELQLTAVAKPAPATMIAAAPPQVEGLSAGSSRPRDRCVEFGAAGSKAMIDLLLPSRGLELRSLPGGVTQISSRRFATAFQQVPVPVPSDAQALSVRPGPDRSAVPWHVRVTTVRPTRVCALR